MFRGTVSKDGDLISNGVNPRDRKRRIPLNNERSSVGVDLDEVAARSLSSDGWVFHSYPVYLPLGRPDGIEKVKISGRQKMLKILGYDIAISSRRKV